MQIESADKEGEVVLHKKDDDGLEFNVKHRN
jgi:hypothetical protein